MNYLTQLVKNYFSEVNLTEKVDEDYTRGELLDEVLPVIHFLNTIGECTVGIMPGTPHHMMISLLASLVHTGRIVIFPEFRETSELLSVIIDTEVSVLLVENGIEYPYHDELTEMYNHVYHTYIGINVIYNTSTHSVEFNRIGKPNFYNKLLFLEDRKMKYQPHALNVLVDNLPGNGKLDFIFLSSNRFRTLPHYVIANSSHLAHAMASVEKLQDVDETLYNTVCFEANISQHVPEYLGFLLISQCEFVSKIDEANIVVFDHFTAQNFIKHYLFGRAFKGILEYITPRFIKNYRRVSKTNNVLSSAFEMVVLKAELPAVSQIALSKIIPDVYLTFGTVESLNMLFVKKLNKKNAKDVTNVGTILPMKIMSSVFNSTPDGFVLSGSAVATPMFTNREDAINETVIRVDDKFSELPADRYYTTSPIQWVYEGKVGTKSAVNPRLMEMEIMNLLPLNDCVLIQISDTRLPDVKYALIYEFDYDYMEEHNLDILFVEELIKLKVDQLNASNALFSEITQVIHMPEPYRSYNGFIAQWCYKIPPEKLNSHNI